jgi:trans-aconitate methyltransferase
VFSNAALHWMLQPDEVLRRIWRSLRPDGRFVAEFGGRGNLAQVLVELRRVLKERGHNPDVIRPWYFPSAEECRERLTEHGFQVIALDHFPRPTELPGDITDWLEMFAQPFLAIVPDGNRKHLLHELRDFLRPVLQSRDGRWIVDYVRLRCHASKPTCQAASR